MANLNNLPELLSFLDKADRQAIEKALDNIEAASTDISSFFLKKFATIDDSSWFRFLHGVYEHPKTWWIGIIQLQMMAGYWGQSRKSEAMIRQSALNAAFQGFSNLGSSAKKNVLSGIVQFNYENRKSDLSGRIAGSVFTNFASTGGLFGVRRLATSSKFSVAGVNFLISSYGAAIKSVQHGMKSIEPILQSILTGHPEEIPDKYCSKIRHYDVPKDGEAVVEETLDLLPKLVEVCQIGTKPVPIDKFCSKPRNKDLESICQ